MSRRTPESAPELSLPLLDKNRLFATYALPDEASYEMVSGFIAGMLGYGIHGCKSFWEGAEQVLSTALEIGDRPLYEALTSGQPIEPLAEGILLQYAVEELEEDASRAQHESVLARTEVTSLNQCYMHGFDIATSCELSSCPYYSKHANLHCGYDRKDIGEMTFEVIAQQLDSNVPEVFALFQEATAKIRNTEFGRRQILEPVWDVLEVEGHCHVCGQESEAHICSGCTSELSVEGAQLMLRFRRPLKDIILLTSKSFDNFQLQAMVLDVNVATLKNLYLRVGINRRTTNAASRSYSATHPRPGKTISSSNHEYLAVEVISARNIFGAFSSEIVDRLSRLNSFVKDCGIAHSPTFIH